MKRSSTFMKNGKRAIAIWLAAVIMLATLTGCAAQTPRESLLPESDQTQNEADTEALGETTVADSDAKHFSLEAAATKTSTGDKTALKLTDIYKKASPSVVAIATESTVTNYFGQESSQPSAGSGIIISGDGYILTCNHVIEDTQTITVMTSDKTEYEAKVLGRDEDTDLAVLKIEATGLTAAALGDSDQLEVGELAVAIGNPLGELANSLTAGVISALDRAINLDSTSGYAMNLLQIDTAISPGNSGGALIDSFGEVVGITSAKSSGTAIEGIGFAIPINTAKAVIDDLINLGYVTGRPLIGITGETIDKAVSEANNLPIGVYVREVSPGGAAEKAGISVGDVIIEFDGEKITTIEDLNTLKNKHKAGDTITVKTMRNNQETTHTLVLDEKEPTTETTTPETENPNSQIPPRFKDYFNGGSQSNGQ